MSNHDPYSAKTVKQEQVIALRRLRWSLLRIEEATDAVPRIVPARPLLQNFTTLTRV